MSHTLNKQWIIFHLQEAQEEILNTIEQLGSEPEYSETDFEIAVAHMYNHLNTAWNSRSVDNDRTANSSDHDFFEWR